jgi:Protein of unknown function (DUF3102)
VETSIERYQELDKIGLEIQDTGRRTGEGIVKIGLLLIDARDTCLIGEWGAWLRKYFNASDTTAYRFMKIAREFSDIPNLQNYSLSALSLLCGNTIEEPVKEAILELGASGEERITANLIDQIQSSFVRTPKSDTTEPIIEVVNEVPKFEVKREPPKWEIKLKPEIEPEKLHLNRQLTALNRMELSSPLKLAINKDFLLKEHSHLDYGCGTGGDIWRLRRLGYQSNGYDPFFFPNNPVNESDVISLIYVLNVIEDIVERTDILTKSWQLTKQTLIIGIRVDPIPSNVSEFGDGHITQLGAFQKHYTQEEAIAYISQTLETKPLALSDGIFICKKL